MAIRLTWSRQKNIKWNEERLQDQFCMVTPRGFVFQLNFCRLAGPSITLVGLCLGRPKMDRQVSNTNCLVIALDII